MRKTEIEKKLKTAISNEVPDVLENILIEYKKKKGFDGTMETMNNKEKSKKEFNITNLFSNKLVSVFAMVIICIVGLFGYGQYNTYYTADSIIEFDVNPSIELEINKKEKVIEVTPLNEDGKKIIEDMDLKNTDVYVAVNAIIGSMLKNGYLSVDSNSILVSVKNDDVEKGNQLQEKISNNIEEVLKASSINGSILAQTYDDDNETKLLANQYSISEGKANLINQILKAEIKDTNGNLITAEALSKLSINELNLLLEAKEPQLNKINTKGTASETSYIGKEKAKEIALNHAEVLPAEISRIEVELDYDDGKLVYEVDFRHNNIEYDYEIDAKTGDIIEFERENDANNGNTNYNNTDYGPNNDGVTDYGITDYNDTDYGPNNDGVTDYGTTDYNDTDYGPNNDGVTDYGITDYNDTDYGTNNNGITDYDD